MVQAVGARSVCRQPGVQSTTPATRLWILPLASALILALAAAIAMWRAPIDVLLRDFSLDDSFYYSQVARNFSATGCSSFDGVELTNGYHPLWMLAVSVVYRVGFDGVEALRATRVLEIGLVLLGVVAIIAGLRRAGMHWTTGLLPLAMATNTRCLVQGLETALLMAMVSIQLPLLVAWLQSPERRWLLSWLGLFGLLGGLARLEFFVLPLVLAPLLWLYGRRRVDAAWRGIAVRMLLPVASGLALYLGVNYLVFDLAVPVSGLVKQFWSAGARSQAELGSSWHHLEVLYRHHRVAEGLHFAVLAMLVLAAWRLVCHLRRRPVAERSGVDAFWLFVVALGMVHAIRVLYFAYTVWPPHGYARHYYVTSWWLKYLVFAGLVQFAIAALPGRPRLHRGAVVLVCLAVLLMVAGGVQDIRKRVVRGGFDWELSSYTGAQWVNQNLPADAQIGSTDSGVLGYFARARVTNLDGLINSAAYFRVLQNGAVQRYLLEAEIRYFCNAVRDPGPGEPVTTGHPWAGSPGRVTCLYASPAQFLQEGVPFRFKVFRFDPSGK